MQRNLIKKDIHSYLFNKDMRWWFFWKCRIGFEKDVCENLNFSTELLREILEHCINYKCKKIYEE